MGKGGDAAGEWFVVGIREVWHGKSQYHFQKGESIHGGETAVVEEGFGGKGSYLRPTLGDQLNLMLVASAWNLRKWMREPGSFGSASFKSSLPSYNSL